MWEDFKFSYSVDIEDCSENVELPKRISDEKCNPQKMNSKQDQPHVWMVTSLKDSPRDG